MSEHGTDPRWILDDLVARFEPLRLLGEALVDVAEFEATTGIDGSVFTDMRERRHIGRSLKLFGEDLDKAARELLDAYPNRKKVHDE